MISPTQLFLNHTSRKILWEFQSQISKTVNIINSDTLSPKDNKFGINLNFKCDKVNKQNNIRALSTIQNQVKPTAVSGVVFPKEVSTEFTALFPDIVRDLTEACRRSHIPEAANRFAEVLRYNIPNGKKNRGLLTVTAYQMLENPENLTPENIRLSNIIGWCIEMLQGYLLMCDDIVDESETRRGQLCWYRQNSVGLQAVNHAILIENSIYSILQKYISNCACYASIVELFHNITFKTAIGQSLDNFCNNDNGKPQLDQFTMNRYNAIAIYKTGYYAFPFPIQAAMYLANIYDPEQHRLTETILLKMGIFLQVEDDFLDCFGNPEITGKIGTDIKDGKCTWLAVVALQRANPAQRKIMEDHYGKSEDSSVLAIRNLYEELELPAAYTIYKEESYNIIQSHIHQNSKGSLHQIFLTLMNRVFKRSH